MAGPIQFHTHLPNISPSQKIPETLQTMKILRKTPENPFKGSSMPQFMNPINQVLLAGLIGSIGGITRSIVGLLKARLIKREINLRYWLITQGVSCVIGGFMGIIFNFDWRISLLAGYAGLDLIEGIYKSFKSQKVIVKAA